MKTPRPFLGRRHLIRLSIASLIGVAWVWMRLPPFSGEHTPRTPPLENIDLSAYPPFAKGVASSSKITLFEGLPHQGWESKLHRSELASKQTFQSHRHDFYRAEVLPSADDATALRNLAMNAAGFQKWGGEKKCGLYHPDWMIRWTGNDGAEHEMHICFGCHEAKLYGPGYQLYCDLRDDAYTSLKAIVQPYANQRPKRAGL